MTDEDILAVAFGSAQAWTYEDHERTGYGFLEPALLNFARRIEDKVREECAKVCDAEATIEGIAQQCAAAIRARGEE